MPFFHYPFVYNPNYYNRFKNYNRRPISITSYMPPNSKKETDAHQVDKNSHQDYKKNNSKSNTDNYFFELFGLKLYFDDIPEMNRHCHWLECERCKALMEKERSVPGPRMRTRSVRSISVLSGCMAASMRE